MLRLERGGAEFLTAVSRHLFEMGAASVYSPALYPGATRVWRRSGFGDYARLDVMERRLDGDSAPDHPANVAIEGSPDWSSVLELDRLAFDGFWGMSRLGLEEAHRTNRDTALLVTRTGDRLTGYCIVGAQWGTVYLHRIAVRPEAAGQGLGAALIGAAVDWGSSVGGQSLVLNVRPENDRARDLYRRLGFASTNTALDVLRLERG
jgi:ribosomal-protein-alanine N-acetyltransferase